MENFELYNQLSIDKAFYIPEPKCSAYMDSYEFETFKTGLKLNFNESINLTEKEKLYFIFLLSVSFSLNKEEKIDFLFNKLPIMSTFQLFELIKLLEEEKRFFYLLFFESKELMNILSINTAQISKEWLEIELDNINGELYNK